jgi:hypothetical protein
VLDLLQRRRSVARARASSAGRPRPAVRLGGIEGLERRQLLAIDVTNLNDAGAGSLRAAIDTVNAGGVADVIRFSDLAAGTIFAKSSLPVLSVSGTSFLFAGSTSAITLDGGQSAAGSSGLTIGSGVNTIGLSGIALTIQNFPQNGLMFAGPSTGTMVVGLTVRGNLNNGIQLAGGGYTGTVIRGSAISGNVKAGIMTLAGATNLIIGGTLAGQGNNIYGNGTNGIELAGGNYASATIAGNRILDNQQNGIAAAAGGVQNLTIGGTTAAAANALVINRANGLLLAAGAYDGTTITGNSIVLNETAGVNLAPGGAGLTNLMLGGTAAGSSNAISGNGLGVVVAPGTYTGSMIQGNSIASNRSHGVSLGAAGSTISALTVGGKANTITGNTGDGINVGPGTYTSTVIQGNTITANTAAGIRLAPAAGGLTGLIVGGTVTTQGNRLAGNSSPTVHADAEIVAEPGTYTETKVQGNDISSGATGILLSAAQGITVGGSTTALGNVVNGTSERGLLATGTLTAAKAVNNTFVNNDIGVRLEGATGFALGETGKGNSIIGGRVGIVANGVLGGTTVRSNRVTGATVGLRVNEAQGASASEPFTVGVNTATAGEAGGNRFVASTHGLQALGNLANTVIIGNIFNAIGANGSGAALMAPTNLLLGGAGPGYGNVLTAAQGSGLYAKGVCTGSRVFRNNMTASRFGILLDGAQALSVGALANEATTNIVQYNQVGLGTTGNTTGSGVMFTRWYRNVRDVVNPSKVAIYPYV